MFSCYCTLNVIILLLHSYYLTLKLRKKVKSAIFILFDHVLNYLRSINYYYYYYYSCYCTLSIVLQFLYSCYCTFIIVILLLHYYYPVFLLLLSCYCTIGFFSRPTPIGGPWDSHWLNKGGREEGPLAQPIGSHIRLTPYGRYVR